MCFFKIRFNNNKIRSYGKLNHSRLEKRNIIIMKDYIGWVYL